MTSETQPVLRILGIRGVPAAHGGFETFAERLALHLVARGWRVVVYCQHEGAAPVAEDAWRGIERVHVGVNGAGPRSTVVFDWKATLHAAARSGGGDLCLTLGYNTALFCSVLRLRGVRNLINMDGIEWQRQKWGPLAKAWFYVNERAGCRLGDHLIADHPEIARHLATRVRADKITTIAYGADRVQHADPRLVREAGLEPGRYLTVIARPEPENSLLEIVRGFSRAPRGALLAVLGRYDAGVRYHEAVRAAAGPEVRFLGAIYERAVVQALRHHALAHIHGHRVGGTNPSLVEALGAGNAVLAHDNRFNRWVLGDAGLYFADADDLAASLEQLLADRGRLDAMTRASQARYDEAFTWLAILRAYETLLERWLPAAHERRAQRA